MSNNNSRDLIVLCNAKSLGEYPFYNYNVDTVGMNIAYRFWHQIGWYPTYYVSLDQNVNLNYAKDLYFLVINRKKFGIKRFLFRKIILKAYPQLRKIREVSFLEDINKNKTRGFYGNQLVTTGSFGVRWGVYLGYKNIYILGVDSFTPLKNVRELIDKNGKLKITISPDVNKFFDGYQKKGDPLHISNKKNKQRNNSHALTFKMIYRDVNKRGVANVYISHPESKLLRKVFPYIPIPEKFLKLQDEWLIFSWNQVIDGILSDRSPKAGVDVEFSQMPSPNKRKHHTKSRVYGKGKHTSSTSSSNSVKHSRSIPITYNRQRFYQKKHLL